MFDGNNVSIAAPPVIFSSHVLQKSSSSRDIYDFGLSLSSSEPVDEEIHVDDYDQQTLRGET